MVRYYPKLNPENAFIWRIVHRDNLPWILEHGLYCGNSDTKAPNWVSIGNTDLISKRATHQFLSKEHGFLGDYIPFYFTPFSPMLYNIHTGYGNIQKRANEEIIFLVYSLHCIVKQNLYFLFTDRHAYNQLANFYDDLAHLDKIDWSSLQARNFRRDSDNPEKYECYQAEALIHKHLPISNLLGIICYTDDLKQDIEQQIQRQSLKFGVYVDKSWYF